MAGKVNQPIVADRLAWIERMVVCVRALPLGSKGVLDARDAHLTALLAGYRNRLVHFYHEISPEELGTICTRDIEDILHLAETLRRWVVAQTDRLDRTL